jgi:NitT/TauT family transport system substrate-binding protein
MKLTLVENFRALFYAPFYVLKERGDAEAEGLEVEWIDANTPGGGVDTVKRGAADLTWGGPMRIMKDHDTHAFGPESLVCFCEVVVKHPFFLVGRESP